jgi:hypothetical protein
MVSSHSSGGRVFEPDLDTAVWLAVHDFVLEAVAACEGRTAYDTKVLSTAAAHLSAWAWESAGLPLRREVIFHRDTIAQFIALGALRWKPAGRGNLRSQLFRMSEVLLDHSVSLASLASFRLQMRRRPTRTGISCGCGTGPTRSQRRSGGRTPRFSSRLARALVFLRLRSVGCESADSGSMPRASSSTLIQNACVRCRSSEHGRKSSSNALPRCRPDRTHSGRITPLSIRISSRASSFGAER